MFPLRCNVPSRNCEVPPGHLRSEILFLPTCNIPNLISYIYCMALETLYWSCVHLIAQLHEHQNNVQCKIFLEETLIAW